jgi:hypothetical protein
VKLLLSLVGVAAAGVVIFVVVPWLVEPPPEVEVTEEEMAGLMARLILDLLAEEGVREAPDGDESGEASAVEETLPFPPSESLELPAVTGAAGEGIMPAPTREVIPVVRPVVPVVQAAPEETPQQQRIVVAAVHEEDVSLRGKAAEPGRPEAVSAPPSGAVREVQGLLKRLGYEPGPLDGVWGDRTARAWKNFARDSADLEARARLAQASAAVASAADTGQAPSMNSGQVTPPHTGLPSHLPEPEGQRMRVPGTLRGVMGYRLPLVSRQEVPDQVVSGVLIPAHTTFVILKPGYWELTGLSADEVRRLEDAAEEAPAPAETGAPPRRSWNPLRMLREQPSAAGGN